MKTLKSPTLLNLQINQQPGNNKKTTYEKNRKWLIILLSCQGSNLDSSDPESDVLPITPQDSGLLTY